MSVIDMIKTSLKYDEDMLRKITKLRVNSQEQTLTLKIENGKKYYYIKKRGESLFFNTKILAENAQNM